MRMGGSAGALELGLVAWVALAVGLGVVIGGGLYAAGVGSGGGTSEYGLDAVAFSSCPRGIAVGEVHRGDRVLATARDESGDWLQVRDPRDLDARVWVLARFVIADGDMRGLPVGGCAESGDVVAAEIGLGGVPVPGVVTPPTTPGGGPVPSGSVPSGSVPSGSVPSGPSGPSGDTTPPAIAAATANPATIYESPCGGQATSATVRVPVSDSGGVASVTIAWSLYSRSGQSTASLAGGQYQASVGPFPQPVGGVLPSKASITITASDVAGNTAQSTATVFTVDSCPI
jgi:hypothetical protein